MKGAIEKLRDVFRGKKKAPSAPDFGPRLPRIHLQPIHAVSCKLEGLEFEVANLCERGLGVLLREDTPAVAPGVTVDGTLTIGEKTFPVHGKLLHRTGKVLGISLIEPAFELIRGVRAYFQTEIGAIEMLRMRSELLQAESDGTPHFFHSANGCSIHFVTGKDGLITRFSLCFFGTYVEGASGENVRVGQLVRDESESAMRYKASEIVRWDSGLAEELLPLAGRFVSGVPALAPGERQQLLDALAVSK